MALRSPKGELRGFAQMVLQGHLAPRFARRTLRARLPGAMTPHSRRVLAFQIGLAKPLRHIANVKQKSVAQPGAVCCTRQKCSFGVALSVTRSRQVPKGCRVRKYPRSYLGFSLGHTPSLNKASRVPLGEHCVGSLSLHPNRCRPSVGPSVGPPGWSRPSLEAASSGMLRCPRRALG